MYVRDARNREEVWLLDQIEAMDLDETAFRSRDYVIAIDEETNEKAGFGRIRLHSDSGSSSEPERSPSGQGPGGDLCELTSIGVLERWRGQGVGAHVIERLIETAANEGFETVFTLSPTPDYLAQFGFQTTDEIPAALQQRLDEKQGTKPDATVLPMRIDTNTFEMPDRLRERFKHATPPSQVEENTAADPAEDFGIDADSATYKYDTGR